MKEFIINFIIQILSDVGLPQVSLGVFTETLADITIIGFITLFVILVGFIFFCGFKLGKFFISIFG